MPPDQPILPAYAERFRCIGSACEDTCCQGWKVPLDGEIMAKYHALPVSPLRASIEASIQGPAEGAQPASFAIRMNAQNQCPLLTADRLCRIQAELGERYLSHTCATYPRIVHSLAGVEEKALALSCPEAARLVVLSPDLLPDATERPSAAAVRFTAEQNAALPECFWPIRASILALVRNRSYPLWQRLFLLRIFCQRLDQIASGELKRTIPAFLSDFDATLRSGALRPAMETLPVDQEAQLDVVLQLAGMLLHRSNVRPRFVECIQAFTAGIGNGPGATLQSLASQYAMAHDRHFTPFFHRHPHILENYLVNTIFRCQFPFGRDRMQPGKMPSASATPPPSAPQSPPPSLSHEFALLTAQFALMKGLLIGVAGFHREAFSTAHVVHTMQAASKHFEHHPEFLKQAHALLVECRMDGARGMAILLSNAGAGRATPASARIDLPAPQA